MTRLGDFFGKQGRFLIENDQYALMCIAVLAAIPFAAWLSATIVALITLRKGWSDGLKAVIVACLALLVQSLISMPLSVAAMATFTAFLPCYLTAGVLHTTASWRVAGSVVVLQALLVVSLIHWLAPEYILNQYHRIQGMLMELGRDAPDNSVANLLNNHDAFNQVLIANGLVGIQAVNLVLSVITSLLLARFIQAKLFYPGGLRKEMLAFRASGLMVVLLFAAAIGAYQHSPLAISCLPVLVTYYVFAGLSFSYSALAKGEGVVSLLLLIILLVILPFVMLPAYAILGALDSLFNFRLRLPSKVGGKRE